MVLRRYGGFIGVDGLDAPDPPTSVTPTAGYQHVSLAFTAPENTGSSTITAFNAHSNGIGLQSLLRDSIGSATFVQSMAVADEDTSPTGLTFKSDGTILYVAGEAGNTIEEYALSTAYDISTESHTSSLDISGQSGDVEDVTFKTDGTIMYVVKSGDDVFQYALSTAWDSSTASYDNKTFDLSGQDTSPTGIAFKPDGAIMYITGAAGDTVEQYALSTAWDVSSASYSKTLSVTAEDTQPEDVEFNSDGTFMYITANNGNGIDIYFLSTAYDIKSAIHVRFISVSSEGTVPSSAFFAPSLNQFWVLQKDARLICEYSIGAATVPSSSPLVIADLTNDSATTASVYAINSHGTSAPAFSSSFTPIDSSNRGLLMGGQSESNVIQYVQITTTGDSQDFGDLTTGRGNGGGTSSATRAVAMCGSPRTNVMDYITMASTGDALDFGDATAAKNNGIGSCSSSTRGIIAGGNTGSRSNVIEYITIGSTGNGTDFGDLGAARDNINGGMSNGTRGVCGYGGYGSSSLDSIEYVTIASLGNASDFGDAQSAAFIFGCGSNSVRGIAVESTTIEYLTIASTGNAVNFGSQSPSRGDATVTASDVRAIITGSGANSLQYITIASTGNSSDFGDLIADGQQSMGVSNAHGGL